MNGPRVASTERDTRLAAIVDGYWRDLRDGRKPNRNQLLQKHEDLASELQACLGALEFIEATAAQPTAAASTGPHTRDGQSSPTDTETVSPTGQVLGDFRIVREIGRGGMGVVYEAEQQSLKRRVALKVLPLVASFEERQLARFRMEAQAAASLRHPNIVPVHAIESDKDIHYYTMQFIEGRPLSELIRLQRIRSGLVEHDLQAVPRLAAEQNSALPVGEETQLEEDSRSSPVSQSIDESDTQQLSPDRAGIIWGESSIRTRAYIRAVVDIGIQAAEALQHAHNAGVVHRDIKPSNLILDDSDNLWVTDFGLALMRDDPGLTQSGEIVGTLRYMSPEQASGSRSRIDDRSDIYSLGATLYELLTLQSVAPGNDRIAVLRVIAFSDPRPLRALNRAVPKDLETIVLKAVAKDPVQRYSSAQAMADDLRRFLDDLPIEAKRPSVLDRMAKWSRRHKPLAAATGLIVITALTALAAWGQIAERQQSSAASALVARLMDAGTAAIPGVIAEMEPYREWVDPVLEQIRSDPATSTESRLRATLALLPVESERHVVFLNEQLLESDAETTLLIGRSLRRHLRPEQFAGVVDSLSSVMKNASADDEQRFAAALVLAESSPADLKALDRSASEFVADRLVEAVALNERLFETLASSFEPVHELLTGRLKETFGDGSQEKRHRLAATRLLARFEQDQPASLTELIKESEPDQFRILMAAVNPDEPSVVDSLRDELARTEEPRWNDAPLDPATSSIVHELVETIEQADGMVTPQFVFCQTLTLERFPDVNDQLAESGFRISSLRPWQSQGDVSVAAIWIRDRRERVVELNLARNEIDLHDQEWQRKGFVPAELAGCVLDGEDRYIAVWIKDSDAAGNPRFVHGSENDPDFVRNRQKLRDDKCGPTRQCAFISADGLQRYCGVWSEDPSTSFLIAWSRRQSGYQGFDYYVSYFADRPPDISDVCVIPGPRRLLPEERLKLAESELVSAPDNRKALHARAKAYFDLKKYELALRDLEQIDRDEPEHYQLLSRTLARLGRDSQARDAVRHFQAIGSGYKAAGLDAIVAANVGEHEDGMNRLEASIKQHRDSWLDEHFLYSAARAYSVASTVISDQDIAAACEDRAVELLVETLDSYPHYVRHVEEERDLDAIRRRPEVVALFDRLRLNRRFTAVWTTDREYESIQTYGRHPASHLIDCRSLAADGYRPRTISVADLSDGNATPDIVTASMWHRPKSQAAGRQLTARKTNAAVALYRLGRESEVWPLLTMKPGNDGSRSNPTLRTSLIHALAEREADPEPVLRRLPLETDPSITQALILCLGEFYPASGGRPPRFKSLVSRLAGLYSTSPDPGVRSAAGWLLRRWRQQEAVWAVDGSLQTGPREPNGRWFLNSEGQMMVLLGPVIFQMGSPPDEPGRGGNETLHSRRIGRTFAIAATEVTVEQFERFLQENPKYRPEDSGSGHHPESVQGSVNWFSAAAWCNWMSSRDGIPGDQWCYEPHSEDGFGEGMKLVPDYLSRTGYRLPTEAEWEYACRGGSSTAWTMGESDRLLGQYAWFKDNSRGALMPVGRLKPNRYGLFDMHGNAYEWSQEHHDDYPASEREVIDDVEDIRLWISTTRRSLRGGSVLNSAPFVRSADRNGDPPTLTDYNIGFRAVRTVKPATSNEQP